MTITHNIAKNIIHLASTTSGTISLFTDSEIITTLHTISIMPLMNQAKSDKRFFQYEYQAVAHSSDFFSRNRDNHNAILSHAS
ncbi:hypothetical protein KA405_06215 [Patescibacteria group bacterium]|nr:hypothetical protein [Patescibacteria group bacterium]